MLRNVFLKTLRDTRGDVVVWGLGMMAWAVVVVCVFASVRDDASLQAIDAMIQGFSPIIRAFIGGEDIPSVTNFEGFLTLEFLNYVPLVLAIFALMEGSAAIAQEEERRTMDFLMAQPVRRWRVVVAKVAALAVAACAIAALAGIGLVIGTLLVPVEAPWGRLMLATANGVPPALVVGAVSLLGSCALRRRRHAAIVGAAFLAASFLLNVLGQIAESIRPWRALSIFHASGASQPLTGDMIADNTVWLLVATVVLLGAAVLAFGRKDLAV